MATASPTPFGASYNDPPERPNSRARFKSQASRPNFKRGAPLVPQSTSNGFAQKPAWKFSIGDSSDDDIPVPPMKFSAGVKALLGDEASIIGGSTPSQKGDSQQGASRHETTRPTKSANPVPLGASLRQRNASPASSRSGSPRIIRLPAYSTVPSKLRKTTSVLNSNSSPIAGYQDSVNIKTSDLESTPIKHDFVTPASRVRTSISDPYSTNAGNATTEAEESRMAKGSLGGSEARTEPLTRSREHSEISEAIAELGNLSINKTKGEDTGAQSSIRVKRVGKVPTGRYLSGPARRGMKRRQSEEDQSPIHDQILSSAGGQPASMESRAESPAPEAPSATFKGTDSAGDPPESSQYERPPHVRFQSQASVIDGSPLPSHKELPRPVIPEKLEREPQVSSMFDREGSSSKRVQPVFKVPPLPPLPSRFDQENDPPPTFKRNKTNGSALLEKQKIGVISNEKMIVQTPATISPARPPLAARSQNTPHRPAPPPPKMTMLETATAPAGAASASQKKKRNYISVNGKLFTRMDCIGRGGSSKVYRVMAENYRVFALKRVTLEDQDELAVRGFKGEIDLLRKLANVDRVVSLLDWEINEERQTLSVLMEMGESDLNKVLTLQLGAEDAVFDETFTRYYWKEMLECVQAVHRFDIVHSDLKPANFLITKGRLKLIDFGISGAIANDTVNMHREQHVGTPNYMSPEMLMDSNASNGLPASAGKMMKIGKPSDVWTLGCILYQMVYGKPPFAHITNQVQRIMAIPNPNHVIAFPVNGVGGVEVPSCIIGTLRSCLNRNATQRPTVDQLLAYGDAFLYPSAASRKKVEVSEELIERMQANMIRHIKERGMPSDAELATWPGKFFASIKAAIEEGRAY